MAYGGSNDDVIDDVTWPSKVKVMIPISLRPVISKTARDWDSVLTGYHLPPQPYIKAVKKFTWRIYALSERLLVYFCVGFDVVHIYMRYILSVVWTTHPTLSSLQQYYVAVNEEVYSPRRQQTMITMTINEHADTYVHGTLYKILKIKYWETKKLKKETFYLILNEQGLLVFTLE